MKLLCGLWLMLIAVSACADQRPLRYYQKDSRYEYRIQLLQLALLKAGVGNEFMLRPLQDNVTAARGLALLERGQLDVAFLPTTVDLERRFRAVKIPILRGILGYRVFLAHKHSLPALSLVKSLDDLRDRFVAGFGAQWSDIDILRGNRLKVEDSPQYGLLFDMLMEMRFDYFPRGLNEAWKELEERQAQYPDLAVEPTLALYYPYPVYFFVGKGDETLARLIEKGLNAALEDGSFEQLFLTHHQSFLNRAQLPQRRVFLLQNPTLPAGTEAPDTHWWLPESPLNEGAPSVE
ncbi:ABC-type amino acid transport/signal transduction systems, periplasmic component/domain [Hahella chejuensis KCTC 2396]|uniref:ABC-type amino acid transport/signal transduction systems, periplasmic component/domain n=1 Tax=Hahella chejuensis (strain KCTC 2396) TaxID=349521 RepID=Q2SNR1_HAHCH|nr:ABC transporter substrate-binding protein [Hahella chejuensis]ABC27713.1 ABC-type amino acid transport/signal transduction systems, periplasmic component/domain [Hahella chejuensis KCTC 2396]